MKVDGNFSPMTKLSLASAIYYKSEWQFEFPPSELGDFHTANGVKKVEMMSHENREFNWGELGDYAEWLAIPYKSDDSLVIILPNQNSSIDQVMRNMDERAFTTLMYEVQGEDNEV